MSYNDFNPDKIHLHRSECPRDIDSLCSFFQALGIRSEFSVLRDFAAAEPRFFSLVQFLWREAKQPFQVPQPLHVAKTVTLSQRDCLRILACAFFCLFTHRRRLGEYPTLNFNLLFDGHEGVLTAKLHMFTTYFLACEKRIKAGDSLDRKISFVLCESHQTAGDWKQCTQRLRNFNMRKLQESIDHARGCWRVDFANQYLGGASLSQGCVQEEIMFSICPELNVGRLFGRVMSPHEAIAMIGAERFSSPRGYGWSLSFGGEYHDPTPVKNGRLQSYIVAMDAEDYRTKPSSFQYRQEHILRDLNKSFAGFSVPEGPSVIATGNWGCGVFGGNPELKLLLQWMSASKANRDLAYFPFDQPTLANQYPALIADILTRQLRVCDLYSFVVGIEKRRSIFDQLVDFLDQL